MEQVAGGDVEIRAGLAPKKQLCCILKESAVGTGSGKPTSSTRLRAIRVAAWSGAALAHRPGMALETVYVQMHPAARSGSSCADLMRCKKTDSLQL